MVGNLFDEISGPNKRQFVTWAKRATKGLVESATFLQIFNAHALESGQDFGYALQLGAAILLDKPIVILAPEGSEIPERLRAIATSVQFFLRDDKQSFEQAMRRGMHDAGVVRQ